MEALIRIAAVTAVFVIAGCAVTPIEHAADSAAGSLAARKDVMPAWPDGRAETPPSFDGPLDLPAALTLAFMHNPEIHRQYARLGIAHADLVQAARIANPRLSFAWLDPDGAGRDRTTQGIVIGFSDLLLLPARRRLSATDYRRVQLEVAARLVALARDVEIAWYSQVSAMQIAAVREAAARAAAAEAELARRFHQAGNIAKLDLDLREAGASRRAIESLRARSDVVAARARLADLLGLGTDAAWRTVDRLPEPPESPINQQELQTLALEQRLDLAAQREEIALLEDSLRVTRRWRWFGGTNIGYERERETDGAKLRGPTLEFELPLFDQHQGTVARAEAQLADARARHEASALAARNEIAAGTERLEIARAIAAQHRDILLPALGSVVARRQERFNYMLHGPFELFDAKGDELRAWQDWLESVRDYWIARSALAAAAGGRLPGDRADWPLTIGAQEITGESS
ncbi:MAG: TolC family protein [Pseudomonadota bacterium]|nr:TolC family protein [Pseudomonadota bacterium]